MDKLKDRILQYIISGDAARSDVIDREIREDPSFDADDFDFLKDIWEKADSLRHYERVEHAEAWQKIIQQTGIESKMQPIRRNRWWLAAASVILLLGLGLYFYLTADPYLTYRALEDEVFVLPDNSTIELQLGTEVRYLKPTKFTEAPNREVYLTGRGIFDVVQEEKPFKVITSLTSVEVLGTKFMYRAEGDFSESENLEGQVKFGTNDGTSEVVLNPGDKASFDGNTLDVERYEPPPPPPVITPSNNVSISDLIDILTEKYMENLVWQSSVDPSDVVVKVNLSEENLDSVIADLQQDSLIQIDVIKTSNGYQVSHFSGTPSGLTADYTYFHHISGIKPNE